jgi:hypothetical protein
MEWTLSQRRRVSNLSSKTIADTMHCCKIRFRLSKRVQLSNRAQSACYAVHLAVYFCVLAIPLVSRSHRFGLSSVTPYFLSFISRQTAPLAILLLFCLAKFAVPGRLPLQRCQAVEVTSLQKEVPGLAVGICSARC